MIVDYDRNNSLGEGISAQVFLGTFAGEQVAVKRIQKRTEQDVDKARESREEKSMKQFNHPNVLKLIEVQEDPDFKYTSQKDIHPQFHLEITKFFC